MLQKRDSYIFKSIKENVREKVYNLTFWFTIIYMCVNKSVIIYVCSKVKTTTSTPLNLKYMVKSG